MFVKDKITQKWKFMVWGILIIPLVTILSFLLIAYTKAVIQQFTFKINFWNIIAINGNNWNVFLIAILIGLSSYGVYCWWLFKEKTSQVKMMATKATNFGSAKWLTTKELNHNYPLVSFNNPQDNNGFVIASSKHKNDLKLNVRNNTHALIIGGTGSGKTQGIVIPTIQVNALSKAKPSLIITDPKGELLTTQGKLLETQGYEIKVLNLREPFHSSAWNPLANIYQLWTDYLWLKSLKNEQQQQTIMQMKVNEEIRDLCQTIFPITAKDPFWDLAASNVVKAIILGMLEDMEQLVAASNCQTKIELQQALTRGLPLQKFNLASVATIATQKLAMQKWFQKRELTSQAKIASNVILSNAEETLDSILATVNSKMEIFLDAGIINIICDNNINFATIVTKPTAVFIILPDERKDRHLFASLFISQIYKALVTVANKNSNQKLQRTVYFLLDEFGNMPAISNIDSIITVARSRNIYLMLILQDWNQLVSKYGNEIANIIFTNCNLHIFLQTMHLKTAQMYSQMIGEATVIQINTSKSGKNITKSEQLKGHKLINPDELIKLPINEAVIFFSKENPARTKLIPWYQTPYYSLGNWKFTRINQQIFAFSAIIYLITQSYFYQLAFQKNPNKNNSDQLNNKTLLTMELKEWQDQLKPFHNLKELTFVEQETKKHIENNIKKILEKLSLVSKDERN